MNSMARPMDDAKDQNPDAKPPAFQVPITGATPAQVIHAFAKTSNPTDPKSMPTMNPYWQNQAASSRKISAPVGGSDYFNAFKSKMDKMSNTGSTLDIQLTESNNCEVRRAPRKDLKERVNGQLLSQKAVAARSGLINWRQLDEFTTLARRKLERVVKRLEGRNAANPTEARTQLIGALGALTEALTVLQQAATKKDVVSLETAQQLATSADKQVAEARQLL